MNRHAKELRKNMTEVERFLWRQLRNRQLHGYKFPRQHTVGRFIVDFVCLEKNLVIEVDGGQHAKNLEADVKRTEYLKEKGYRVLRFWNNEVLQETESVLSVICSWLLEDVPPHPNPLPPIMGEREISDDLFRR